MEKSHLKDSEIAQTLYSLQRWHHSTRYAGDCSAWQRSPRTLPLSFTNHDHRRVKRLPQPHFTSICVINVIHLQGGPAKKWVIISNMETSWGQWAGLWTLRASPSPTRYSGIKMPLNISVVTHGEWLEWCEIWAKLVWKALMNVGSCQFRSSRRRRTGSPRPETKRTICTEFVISGEELRNVLLGGFSPRDSKSMWCWHVSCSWNFYQARSHYIWRPLKNRCSGIISYE